MIVEISSLAGLILFLALFLRDRDIRYLVGFGLGLFVSFWVESVGVAHQRWVWQNIAYPFSYTILGVPIAVHLIYASAAGLVLPLTKYLIALRDRAGDGFDRKVGYLALALGVLLVLTSLVSNVSISVGATFIMFGLYLFVKDPIIFYVGAAVMVVDLVLEHLMIFNNQLDYTIAYGDVGTGFFLVGAILAALILILDRSYSWDSEIS